MTRVAKRIRRALIRGATRNLAVAQWLTGEKQPGHDAELGPVEMITGYTEIIDSWGQLYTFDELHPNAVALVENWSMTGDIAESDPHPGSRSVVGPRAMVVAQPLAAAIAIGQSDLIIVKPSAADQARKKMVGHRVAIIEGRKRSRKRDWPKDEDMPDPIDPGSVIATGKIVRVFGPGECPSPWSVAGMGSVELTDVVPMRAPVPFESGPGWLRLDKPDGPYQDVNEKVREQEREGVALYCLIRFLRGGNGTV